MQIIATAITKGGTGKTTTAAALAQAATADGKKVLCIDLDPQGNLSAIIGADPNGPGSYDLLHGAKPGDVIQATEQGLDAITASPDLATEKTTPSSAMRLQAALKPLKKGYDLIFIDTPPLTSELTFNALQAATDLIIPLETDSNALQGLYQINDIARHFQQSNKALKVRGTVLVRYDPRSKINRILRDAIEKAGEEIKAPLLTEIRAGIAIREAQAQRLSLYEYAPKSKPAQDYLKLYSIITGGLK